MNLKLCARNFFVLSTVAVAGDFVPREFCVARGDEAQTGASAPRAVDDQGASTAEQQQTLAAMQERIAALESEHAKLRADVARSTAQTGEAGRRVAQRLASFYPSPAPLDEPEQVSPYSVKQVEDKRLPPPQSLKRRREGGKSASSLPRPGGDIEQKPRKMSKGEMIDVYFRTSGGEAAMTEVVNALRRLDEDIRFSQNGDQLLVRTTRAGQEVVRQLIHYYEEQMNANE
ncbi:MAG TPA: hypothetical protein VFW87_25190 [Pirellulales bacterium]|nr:hypothetical protein [Pirellulales bacterium]